MSSNQWFIILGYDTKPHQVIIQNPETVTVAEFKKKVQEETGLQPNDQRLMFAASEMRDGKLSDYPGMGNGSTVHIIQRLKGGSREVDPSVPRCTGPCIVTTENYDEQECVKMPCGHAIHPDQLVEFCHSEVYDNQKWEIVCFHPGCKHTGVLSMEFIVKCGMTQDELNLLTKGMSENYCKFNPDAGIQKCPGCQCLCERTDKTKDEVRCDQCTRKNGTPYYFCCLCSHPWTSGHQCKVIAVGALDILAKLEETTINGVKCPSIRMCPNCEVLIQHTEGCKEMRCQKCNHIFCFVCLRLRSQYSSLPCHGKQCEPAPRQTIIPASSPNFSALLNKCMLM